MFCVAPFMDETLEYYRAKVHASERKWDDRLKAMRNYVEVGYYYCLYAQNLIYAIVKVYKPRIYAKFSF